MAEFFQYLRNITYYLVFAAVVNMAAPSGKYQRYIRLVTGLILVALLFAPLRTLLNEGVPVTALFSGLVPVPAATAMAAEGDWTNLYEQQQYDALQAAFEEQLRRQVGGLLSQQGCTLLDASFDYAPDFSDLYHVSLTASVIPRGRPFIYIEPVRVPAVGGGSAGSGSEEAEPDDNVRAIKKWVADFYNLSPDHIDVRVIYE